MVTLKRACELHQRAMRKEAVYLMVLVIALALALACAIAHASVRPRRAAVRLCIPIAETRVTLCAASVCNVSSASISWHACVLVRALANVMCVDALHLFSYLASHCVL